MDRAVPAVQHGGPDRDDVVGACEVEVRDVVEPERDAGRGALHRHPVRLDEARRRSPESVGEAAEERAHEARTFGSDERDPARLHSGDPVHDVPERVLPRRRLEGSLTPGARPPLGRREAVGVVELLEGGVPERADAAPAHGMVGDTLDLLRVPVDGAHPDPASRPALTAYGAPPHALALEGTGPAGDLDEVLLGLPAARLEQRHAGADGRGSEELSSAHALLRRGTRRPGRARGQWWHVRQSALAPRSS